MVAAGVNLFLAANDTYVPGAVATLASARETSSRPLTAYVVDIDMRAESRGMLETTGVPVVWIRLSPRQREYLVSLYRHEQHPSWEVYTRLLAPHLLPQGLDRIIYLDADTLVLSDIAELADVDLHGRTLGAAACRWVAGLYTRKILGKDPGRPLQIPRYFSTGVMLIDLEKWRTNNVTRRLADLLAKRHPFAYYDQDPMNICLRDDWSELAAEWNRQLPARGVVPATSAAVAREEPVPRERLLHEAKILHFVGTRKPWTPGADFESEVLELFRRYASGGQQAERRR